MANNFFQTLKNKVKNIFSSKPKVYLLNEKNPINTDGTVETRPIYSFLSNLGSKLVDFSEGIKGQIRNAKIKNVAYEHSTSLTTTKAKSPEHNHGLINTQTLEAPSKEFIIPENTLQEATLAPSGIAKTDSAIYKRIFSTEKSHVGIKDLSHKKGSISSSVNRHYNTSISEIDSFRGTIDSHTPVEPTIQKDNERL